MEEVITTPLPVFVTTLKQQRLLDRFATEFFLSFPNVPCAHCSILILPRSVKWKLYDANNPGQYQLQSVFHIPLVFNLAGSSIAVCAACSRNPRNTPDIGPWNDRLFEIPQRWRGLLSPIQLHCNLGRTQSQTRTGVYNIVTTYRTLKGGPCLSPSNWKGPCI